MNCHCGGVFCDHNVGDTGCLREIVKVAPRKVSWPGDRWYIGKTTITGATLREQRMYHQHDCGRWSRPKGGVSVNSLPDET